MGLDVNDVQHQALNPCKFCTVAGGTTLNLNVSTHFELACGNKGYSFDAAMRNRLLASAHPSNASGLTLQEAKRYHALDESYEVMENRGWEDCDWISLEVEWSFWTRFGNHQLVPFHRRLHHQPEVPLELHIPCRDPVDHLMSMLNHVGTPQFDCNATDVCEEVETRLWNWNLSPERFSMELQRFPNILLKCFDWKASYDGRYMDYIGSKLLRKRKTTPFVEVSTNKPRSRGKECV